jgi:hypothetical protein
MKVSGLVILVCFGFISCKNSYRLSKNRIAKNSVSVVEDSTKVPGYNESQRMFAYYLLSLPKEERDKWINGAFTEEEKNLFLDSIEIRLK